MKIMEKSKLFRKLTFWRQYMRFIGDIHANIHEYQQLTKGIDNSVQVGDFGLGFGAERLTFSDGNHRFIRGNHDDPSLCRSHLKCIKDGTYEDGIMYIGGATSVDRNIRTPGFDWWFDEQISTNEMNQIEKVFKEKKPSIMVTHECPESISNILCTEKKLRKYYDDSNTRVFFEELKQLKENKVKLWVFGHWHVSFDKEVDGCRYICLNINEHKDIDLKKYRG